MASSDDQEMQLTPPTIQRVLHRAFCISAIVCRSFIDEDSEDDGCKAFNERIRAWLTTVRVQAELESWEAAALGQPLGMIDQQTRVKGSWMSEGLVVLAWAMKRHDLPSHDVAVDPQNLVAAMEFLNPDAAALQQALQLRSADEIERYANRAFALHWRVRQFSLVREHMNFAEFARTAWFGPLNIEGVALADDDLAIHGVPIARAPEAAFQQASSIGMERHRAFNWLLGYDAIYSEVDTST